MEYLVLKWVHILSATLLFGTGLGSAFYKLMTDQTGNLEAIAQTNRTVVLADWLFTTPTVILQPITGVWLALAVGYPLSSSWIVLSVLLYVIAGLCWLPVVYLQIRMRDLAVAAVNEQPRSALRSTSQELGLAWCAGVLCDDHRLLPDDLQTDCLDLEITFSPDYSPARGRGE